MTKEERRAYAKKYRTTPEGKAGQLRRQRKYRATEKAKEWQRRWNAEFRNTAEGRFHAYQGNARHRGIAFGLSLEQFRSFWQKPCEYCHSAVPLIGLDRVDNSIGYTATNVVSCCAVCNYMKRSWPRELFVEQCRKIARVADLEDLVREL